MSKNTNETSFLLQNLMEHMTDNIYFKDVDSRFLMVNRAFCVWTGLPEESVIGKTDFDLFAAQHAQQAFDAEKQVMLTGDPIVGIQEKETWENGRITWVSTTKMPLKDSLGNVIGTFGISRDITEQKEAEFRAAYYSEQVQRIKEQMEEDVRMAAELQKTFFPRSYPTYPLGVAPEDSCVEFSHYYRASSMVSGDFCTIVPLSREEVGIFLCDVMGHGVRAALVTALICALVEETSDIENDPGQFLARMNRQLIPILRQDDLFLYATSCYMVYNASTGLMRFANAGHPVPLFLQSKSGTASWLMDDASLRGPALAIVEDMEFMTFEKQMHPGDVVLMYTDGLYEVLDENNQEFGEHHLLPATSEIANKPLDELIPELIQAAGNFSVDGEFDDDVCMIGFKCHSFVDDGE